MLSTENIKWDELQDAYGDASCIPRLLEKVLADKYQKNNSDSGPWFELWSRLCHQGIVYSASYAVVPILVDAIPHKKSPIDFDFFLMPVCIEIARNQVSAPKIPDDLGEDYFIALKKMSDLVEVHDAGDVDEFLKRALQAARFVVSGDIEKAEKLFD